MCNGQTRRRRPGMIAETAFQNTVKPRPLLREKAGILPVDGKIGKVPFFMSNVEIADDDQRFVTLFSFRNVFPEAFQEL